MSSISSQTTRDFNKALSSSLNSIIKVVMEIDYPTHYFIGRLGGFDVASQSITLTDSRDEKHNKFNQIFIHGSKWISFSLEGDPFPIEALAARLRSILPANSVDITSDNVINCLGGKIKVSEHGVQGRGPTHERIEKI